MKNSTQEKCSTPFESKEKVPFPHDTFFRKSLRNRAIARDFFQHNLPSHVLEKIDLDKLDLKPNSFINAEGQSRFKDLVYEVDIQDKPGQLFLFLEHQSTKDQWIALRIQSYLMNFFLHLVEQGAKKLPPVLCCLFYHGKKSFPPYLCDFFELFEDKDWAKAHILQPFHLIDLTQKSDDELLTHGKAAVLEVLQKNIRSSDISIALEKLKREGCFQPLAEFVDYLKLMIKYVLQEGRSPSKKILIQNLSEALPKQEKQFMATIAQELIQEGKQEGMKQGIKQGMQQGKLAMARNIALKLIRQGISLPEVKQLTELADEQIQNLVEEKI